MQVGPSRELFELWAPDARNGLIITGYSIEGTLARVSAFWQGCYLSTAAPTSCIYDDEMDMFSSLFLHFTPGRISPSSLNIELNILFRFCLHI